MIRSVITIIKNYYAIITMTLLTMVIVISGKYIVFGEPTMEIDKFVDNKAVAEKNIKEDEKVSSYENNKHIIGNIPFNGKIYNVITLPYDINSKYNIQDIENKSIQKSTDTKIHK